MKVNQKLNEIAKRQCEEFAQEYEANHPGVKLVHRVYSVQASASLKKMMKVGA